MSVYERERECAGFPESDCRVTAPISVLSDGRMRSTTGEKCSLKEKQREVAAVGLALWQNLFHGLL